MEERTEPEPKKLIRIAITGPESTGKSALAKELAQHYQTCYVREAARKYIRDLKRPYDIDDLWRIARIQLAAEKCYSIKSKDYLFCDTELTVIKIWAIHKYGKCPPFVLKKLEEVKYDLYLLCNVDMPWEPDPLREHPDQRKYFFKVYKEELAFRKLPFVIISGLGSQRTQNAIDAVEAFRRKEILFEKQINRKFDLF